MPVKVKCRGCQKVLTAPDKARGKTLSCPDCGEKIRVPAGDGDAPPAKRKADKPEKSAKKPKDDDDFLSGLRVEQLEAEHGEERVCPYCAAEMDPEDPVCQKCGMNIETGRKDAQMAKKLSRKGPDPALFYSTAWSDSWEFLMKHWRLAARTGGIWTLFLTVAFACPFMVLIWVDPPFSEGPLSPEPEAAPVHGEEVMVRSKVPSRLFWLGVATVFGFGVPGWYWSLSLKVIQHTMERQELREDRIQFDVFESIALGLRLIFWPLIIMLPLSPVWFLVFLFVGGGLAVISGGSAPVLGTFVLIMYAAYFVLPFLVYPQALVHMSVRHRFKAWILWDQIVIFFKNAGATLYWWLMFLCTFLPAIVLGVLFLIFADRIVLWTLELMLDSGIWLFGFIMDTNDPGIFFMVLLSFLVFAMLAPVAAVYAFLMAFPALYMMRANGLYGYYRRETLDLVTQVSENQRAGFWVRFLCRAVDATIIGISHVVIFYIPIGLVAVRFPLALYFGGLGMAFLNLCFVAIAGSKNKKAAMGSLGLGVLAGITFIYGFPAGPETPPTVPFFTLVFVGLFYLLPLYNAWMYYAVNEASTQRSTIGKETFGLIVQTLGTRKELTLGQASLRHLGRILCDIPLSLPYIAAAFTETGQAPHDMMAKAEVVFRGDK